MRITFNYKGKYWTMNRLWSSERCIFLHRAGFLCIMLNVKYLLHIFILIKLNMFYASCLLSLLGCWVLDNDIFSTLIYISVSDRLLEIRLNYQSKSFIYQSFPTHLPTIYYIFYKFKTAIFAPYSRLDPEISYI